MSCWPVIAGSSSHLSRRHFRGVVIIGWFNIVVVAIVAIFQGVQRCYWRVSRVRALHPGRKRSKIFLSSTGSAIMVVQAKPATPRLQHTAGDFDFFFGLKPAKRIARETFDIYTSGSKERRTAVIFVHGGPVPQGQTPTPR